MVCIHVFDGQLLTELHVCSEMPPVFTSIHSKRLCTGLGRPLAVRVAAVTADAPGKEHGTQRNCGKKGAMEHGCL
jgi:hypothetical protein